MKPRIMKRAGWWYCQCSRAWANSRISWEDAYQKWWSLVNTYQ